MGEVCFRVSSILNYYFIDNQIFMNFYITTKSKKARKKDVWRKIGTKKRKKVG